MICPACGSPAAGNFCSNCGSRLPALLRTSPDERAEPVAQAESIVAEVSVPAPDNVPPTPAPSSLCPACRQGVLHATEVKQLLRVRHELLCDRCGAVLVDRGGQPRLLELQRTRNPLEANWQRFKHQSLTALEWQRIAAGGGSDAEQTEADLVKAMLQLRTGAVELPSADGCALSLRASERPLFVLASISLQEPRGADACFGDGAPVREAQGVTIRRASFRSRNRALLRTIDHGVLVLTNKRLCFAGRQSFMEADLNAFVYLDAYADALAVRRPGKQKSELFFGLERHGYDFQVEGRSYREQMSGLILKYAIEGLLAKEGDGPSVGDPRQEGDHVTDACRH